MRKQKKAVSVRVDAESCAYLRALAMSENATITEALAAIVAVTEKLHGVLEFSIKHCIDNDGDYYALALGAGESFVTYPTLAEARSGLAVYREMRGLDARRFPLRLEIEIEDLRDPPLATDHNTDAA